MLVSCVKGSSKGGVITKRADPSLPNKHFIAQHGQIQGNTRHCFVRASQPREITNETVGPPRKINCKALLWRVMK